MTPGSRLALRLAALTVLLGAVAAVAVLWVDASTDTGLMCGEPFRTENQPAACSVYDLPVWLFGLAAASAVAALVSLVVGVVAARFRPGE